MTLWGAAPSGRGRLLDLACGTGQLAFPLAPWFAEVWAVDSEPDMIDMVRAKAAGAGSYGAQIQAAPLKAEELQAEPGSFELIVIGNAFHRLKRERVARRAYDWLPPGRCLALCWSFMPWNGLQEWQRVRRAAAALEDGARRGQPHPGPAGPGAARAPGR